MSFSTAAPSNAVDDRTEARIKVHDAGITRLLAQLGPDRLPQDLLPPVTLLRLNLPNRLGFEMRARGVGINVALPELVRQAYRFRWETPSGAVLDAKRSGKRWRVIYYGAGGRESSLFKVFCRDLPAYAVVNSKVRIKPRTDRARNKARELGFIEMDEEGNDIG